MPSPAVPATVTYVTDPLIPVDVERQREVLRREARPGAANSGTLGILCTTAVSVVIGLVVGALTISGVGVAVGLVGVMALPFGLGWFEAGKEQLARRNLRRLDARWRIAAPGEVGDLVREIADDIRALPEHMRADFAPLVTAVRECCSALELSPGDPRFLGMVRDRAVAVGQVRREYQAVEARQRAQDAADRFGGDPTGQDLVIANQIRDALIAIRAGLETEDVPNDASGEPDLGRVS